MEKLYDVIIAGGGPAGLTAALYLARAKYRVLVMEKEQFGGQIAITEDVENYPGITRVSGTELTQTMRTQAESFGAEFMIGEVTGFDLSQDVKTIYTAQGTFQCFGILIATGAHPRPVGFKGEEAYKGKGVAYCATCDGEFFTGKEIFVIGGGYAAAEEGVFLTKFARHVTILIRRDDFSCAKSIAEEAWNHEKITVLTNTVMEEISGDRSLNYARYKNTKTGQITEYRNDEGFGVFVFAGYAPATDFLNGVVEVNEQGYIITDEAKKTSAEGVYAAGDVCIKPLRQVVTATSDGALAATELEKYVAAMQKKTGLRAKMPSAKKAEKTVSAYETTNSIMEHSIFTSEMLQQLNQVFSRMEGTLILKLCLDNRPVSGELEAFITALADVSDKLIIQTAERTDASETAPCVRIYRENGDWTGLAFHGVPGGHEFTSFILCLYNAAGPGQALEADVQTRIESISSPIDIKILVTLSCTLCPDTVIAAQRIAAQSEKVTAEVYDIHHFEHLRKQYNVMSVPCLIVNNERISFGKKTINQLLDIISL